MQRESRLAKSQRREQILSMLPLIVSKQNADGLSVAEENTSQMLNSFSMAVKIECGVCEKGRGAYIGSATRDSLAVIYLRHDVCLSFGRGHERNEINCISICCFLDTCNENEVFTRVFFMKNKIFHSRLWQNVN